MDLRWRPKDSKALVAMIRYQIPTVIVMLLVLAAGSCLADELQALKAAATQYAAAIVSGRSKSARKGRIKGSEAATFRKGKQP
jgi:hypothetical protein